MNEHTPEQVLDMVESIASGIGIRFWPYQRELQRQIIAKRDTHDFIGVRNGKFIWREKPAPKQTYLITYTPEVAPE